MSWEGAVRRGSGGRHNAGVNVEVPKIERIVRE
jgi:hypothetical protein